MFRALLPGECVPRHWCYGGLDNAQYSIARVQRCQQGLPVCVRLQNHASQAGARSPGFSCERLRISHLKRVVGVSERWLRALGARTLPWLCPCNTPATSTPLNMFCPNFHLGLQLNSLCHKNMERPRRNLQHPDTLRCLFCKRTARFFALRRQQQNLALLATLMGLWPRLARGNPGFVLRVARASRRRVGPWYPIICLEV